MTGETDGMAVGDGFEAPLLEPEIVAQIRRRFGCVFFVRSALWLVGLMADRTALRYVGFRSLRLLLPRDGRQAPALIARPQSRFNYIDVFVVRKVDHEFAAIGSSGFNSVSNVTETGKKKPGGIARRDVNMAVRADGRCRSLAGKKLLAVTIEAGLMFRKLGDVRKGRVALAYLIPILRRNLVA